MKEIYETVLHRFCEKIKPTQQIKYHENSDKTAVIIDPRYNDLMEDVIRQHMYFLNACGWNLLIISHPKYEERIKNDFPNCLLYFIDEKMITYKEDIPNITIDGYNSILLNLDFWTNLPTETILIFQTDCFMYKMFDDTFLEYDFLGASNVICLLENNTQYLGINGGLSLRKKTAMIDCILKLDFQNIYKIIEKQNIVIEKEHNLYKQNEDIFFSLACEFLGKKLIPYNDRKMFSIEAEYNIDTCFHHGWNKSYHTQNMTMEILASTSEYKDFLSNIILQ